MFRSLKQHRSCRCGRTVRVCKTQQAGGKCNSEVEPLPSTSEALGSIPRAAERSEPRSEQLGLGQPEESIFRLTFDTFLTTLVIQFPNHCRLEQISSRGKSRLLLAGTQSSERSDKGHPDTEKERQQTGDKHTPARTDDSAVLGSAGKRLLDASRCAVSLGCDNHCLCSNVNKPAP